MSHRGAALTRDLSLTSWPPGFPAAASETEGVEAPQSHSVSWLSGGGQAVFRRGGDRDRRSGSRGRQPLLLLPKGVGNSCAGHAQEENSWGCPGGQKVGLCSPRAPQAGPQFWTSVEVDHAAVSSDPGAGCKGWRWDPENLLSPVAQASPLLQRVSSWTGPREAEGRRASFHAERPRLGFEKPASRQQVVGPGPAPCPPGHQICEITCLKCTVKGSD